MFGKDAKPGAYHCTFIKADGTQCLGYATKRSQFCRAHDPALADVVQEARIRGGKHAQATYAKLTLPPAPPVSTHADVLQGLQDLISRIRDRHLGIAETRALVDLYQSIIRMLPPPEDPRLAGIDWHAELEKAGVPIERIEPIFTRMVNHVMSRSDTLKPSVRVEYVHNWRGETSVPSRGAEDSAEPGATLQLADSGAEVAQDNPLHDDLHRGSLEGQYDAMGSAGV
jgi:hypothetical protein